MRATSLGLVLLTLAACSNGLLGSGNPRLAMGVEVPCALPAEDLRVLRGRTDAMMREEQLALSRSLALVDAAAMMGADVRAIRQGMVERSSDSLRLQIGIEADIACGFTTSGPRANTAAPEPPPERTVRI